MIKQNDNSDEVKAFAKTIPLQRIAKPEDVSQMVAFLASDEANYSTGSEFIVDGGLTAKQHRELKNTPRLNDQKREVFLI